MGIGRNIKRIRELRGLTQDELGKKLGISGRTISSWDVDRTEPNMAMAHKWWDLVGVGVEIVENLWKLCKKKNRHHYGSSPYP